jgi:hypothetical protein
MTPSLGGDRNSLYAAASSKLPSVSIAADHFENFGCIQRFGDKKIWPVSGDSLSIKNREITVGRPGSRGRETWLSHT